MQVVRTALESSVKFILYFVLIERTKVKFSEHGGTGDSQEFRRCGLCDGVARREYYYSCTKVDDLD